MTEENNVAEFRWGMLTMMLIPYFLLTQVDHGNTPGAILAAIAVITFIGSVAFIIKNREGILAGILATLFLLGILAAFAAIPVVGWIADVVIIIFTLVSVLNAIKMLAPIAIKAALMWAVFAALLIPEWHHPIYSSIGYAVFCLAVTVNLSRRMDPYGELLLLISAIPLLVIVIASLGKMFKSTQINTKMRFDQPVSGYTTKAGVSVDGYVRGVAKDVMVSKISINPNAAIGSSSGVSATKKDNS